MGGYVYAGDKNRDMEQFQKAEQAYQNELMKHADTVHHVQHLRDALREKTAHCSEAEVFALSHAYSLLCVYVCLWCSTLSLSLCYIL